MNAPRSANKSYSSREYSYKSQQLTNELPTKESRHHRNENESFFHKEATSSSIFQSPRMTTRITTTKTPTSSNIASSPGSYINEPELQWPHSDSGHHVLSAAINTRVRSTSPCSISESHNIHSFSLPHPANDDRDQFSIFGSFKKQKSERRTNSNKTELAKVVESNQINYRNLPVKQAPQQQQSPLQHQQSQPQLQHQSHQQLQQSPNTALHTNAQLHTSGYFTPSMQNNSSAILDYMSLDEPDSQRRVEPIEPILKARTQKENQASPPLKQYSEEIGDKNNSDIKAKEIERLSKNLDKVHAKMKALQKNNEELKNHVKNLLTERKQLIKQIENTEFEEIIEEEEVQRAKANLNPKEEPNQQRSLLVKQDVVSENFIEKNKLTLSDVPSEVLHNYRKEIIDQEREKMDIEKRTLMEALNIQYQQQLQSLKLEHESQQVPVKNVPVNTVKRTRFNDVILEADFPNFKVPLRSIATHFQPQVSTKGSQNEVIEPNKKLAKEANSMFQNHMKRSHIKTTKWQESIIQRITQSLESNNSGELVSVIGEMMFKPSRSIEVTAKPLIVSKQSQTDVIEADNGKMAKQTDMLLKSFIKKTGTTTTKWQNSFIDRFVDSLQANNSQKLSSLIQEILFKTSRTIGVNSAPLYSSKTTQTEQRHFGSIIYDVNMGNDMPVVEKISKSVSAEPSVLHKGSQPEELYQFETGTMTDHIFYRSQGVNTFGDHTKTAVSPYSDIESYTTRTSNTSTAKRQIKSQTTIFQSSTNHTVNPAKDIHSSIVTVKQGNLQSTMPEALSTDEWSRLSSTEETKHGKDSKETKKSNDNSNYRHVKESIHKTDSVDSSKSLPTKKEIPITISKTNSETTTKKPKQVVEELEQKIEESVQILTAHVDKDNKLKEETQTTVECWETVSKIKDGKLVEKKENYRDKFTSSDPVEILKHLESHTHEDHHHTEQISPINSAHVFSVISGKESKNRSNNWSESSDFSPNILTKGETNIPTRSEIYDNVYQKSHTTTSSTIPIFKGTVEIEPSKYGNINSSPLEVLTHPESHTHDKIKETSSNNNSRFFSENSGTEHNIGSAHEYSEKYEYKTNLSTESSKDLTKERINIPVNSGLDQNIYCKTDTSSSSTIPISRNINSSEYGSISFNPTENIRDMSNNNSGHGFTKNFGGESGNGSIHEYSERYEYRTNISSGLSKDLTKGTVSSPIISGLDQDMYRKTEISSSSTIPISTNIKNINSSEYGTIGLNPSEKIREMSPNNSGHGFTKNFGGESGSGSTHEYSERYEYKTNISSGLSKDLTKETVNSPINSGLDQNIYRQTDTSSSSTIPISMNINSSEYGTSEKIREMSPNNSGHGFTKNLGGESGSGSTHEYSERYEYKTNISSGLSKDLTKERVNNPLSPEMSENGSSRTFSTNPIWKSLDEKDSLNPECLKYSESSIHHHQKVNEIHTNSGENFTESRNHYKTNIFTDTSSSKGLEKEEIHIPINSGLSENVYRKTQTTSSSTIPIFQSTTEKSTSEFESIRASPIGILKHLESHTHEKIRGISPSNNSFGVTMISGRESSPGLTREYSEKHEYKKTTSTELSRDMSKDRVNIPINSENAYKRSETSSSSTIPLFINTGNITPTGYESIFPNPSEISKHIETPTHESISLMSPGPSSQGFSAISGKESHSGSTHEYSEKYEYKTNISTGSSKSFSKDGANIPTAFGFADNGNSQTISSSTIPIFKSTGEKITSRHENISKITTKLPVVSSRHETPGIEHIMSPTDGSVTASETSSSSTTHDLPSSMSIINSPNSFSSFSSRSTNSSLPKHSVMKKDKSEFESHGNRKEVHVRSSTSNSKPTAVRKLIKTQHIESNPSSQPTDVQDQHSVPKAKNTKIQINRLHSSDGSAAMRSGNSAFHSISEQKQFIPLSPNDNAEHLEILLPEDIFQLASQVLVWLNGNKHNLEQMPKEMIKSSTLLIDWWVDMVVKLSANHLATTIQYLISTFSKNLVHVLVTNRDQQGNTCLHYIIGHQRWESFSVLCATGLVDPNIYNIQGFTVMMLAATLQVSDDVLNSQIRKLTINANINLQSKEQGQTAIYLAALHNNDNTILFLYSHGADINIPDYEGNTPLLVAVSKNNVKAVKAILSCPKALVEIQNKEGKNALKIAELNNFSAIISLFQQRKPVNQAQRSSLPTLVGVVGVSRSGKFH